MQVKREPVELPSVVTADFTPTRQQIAQLEAQLPKVVTSFNRAEIDAKWNRYVFLYWGTGKGRERGVVLFATEWDEFLEGTRTLDGIYPKIFASDEGCSVFWAQLAVESATVDEFRCNGGRMVSVPHAVQPERRTVLVRAAARFHPRALGIGLRGPHATIRRRGNPSYRPTPR